MAEAANSWSTAITDDNHGPLLSIAASLMLVGMFMFLAFRLYIRWPWRQLIGWDDWAVIIGSLLAFGQSIAVFQAVKYGLGQKVNANSLELRTSLEQSILASDILSIMALTGSKLAVSLLILRLSSFKRHVLASRIVTAFIILWGVTSTIGTGIIRSNFRLGPKSGWIGVGTVSFIIEVALFLLPIYLVWNLQMKLSSKLTIIIGFAFRIPASALTLLRVLAVVSIVKGGDNPDERTIDVFWEYLIPTIYTTIEMHYSLMAATIPCMHLFLKNFETGYLRTTADQIDPSSTKAGSQTDSYVLGRTSRLFRADGVMTTSSVVHPDHITEAESTISDGSDRIIVRQTVDVKWDDGRN
ncbi:hypothetical protein AC579_7044 [Pseudocercospora musae]|uniref:Rhodopsin domain-containing protein n=1 Tax=Pseudocercospora musae TaxID=113226 RepID=A0A139IAV3_9PEZI|nr:hypothetical protein AC579_7044 [Pseudocercospora musae]